MYQLKMECFVVKNKEMEKRTKETIVFSKAQVTVETLNWRFKLEDMGYEVHDLTYNIVTLDIG